MTYIQRYIPLFDSLSSESFNISYGNSIDKTFTLHKPRLFIFLIYVIKDYQYIITDNTISINTLFILFFDNNITYLDEIRTYLHYHQLNPLTDLLTLILVEILQEYPKTIYIFNSTTYSCIDKRYLFLCLGVFKSLISY